MRASDQVQSAVIMASTGAITPNCPGALRGPNNATGTKAAVRTTPDNHHREMPGTQGCDDHRQAAEGAVKNNA